MCQALLAAGAGVHLAETAETRARRGGKRRAKTDRADTRWLRTLPAEGRLPEAWIPPAHVRGWRTRTRLRKTLVDERTSWLQRIQATLFHHGIGGVPDRLPRVCGRALLSELELTDAARERIWGGTGDHRRAQTASWPRSSATSARWPAARRAAGN